MRFPRSGCHHLFERPDRHAGFAQQGARGTSIVPAFEGFMKSHLSWRDALLALAVVFVWGTNFVVIRLGLDALPPLFFATLRFLFVVLPAVIFLPRPKVAWSNLAFYGVCIGLFQ